MQITEFLQLIPWLGPCWAVFLVVSNFSATSSPNTPWAALGCPGLGGTERGGPWGWGDSLSGSGRVLVWLMRFHFLRVFYVYVLCQMWLIRGKCSNWPLLVGTVQGVGGCSKEMRTVKPQPTLLTFKGSQLMQEKSST